MFYYPSSVILLGGLWWQSEVGTVETCLVMWRLASVMDFRLLFCLYAFAWIFDFFLACMLL
jgi:hypothetical protein